MAATWPSIIPEGETKCAPASACDTRLADVELEGGVVVDRAAASSTPQCPWSVNSSRQVSAMIGRSSPTSARTAAIARLRMPSAA